ncbi:hypothetical protein TNCV_3138651 [Trichonephila clavipes]|nr:hypothetical protein TNCV_3138651 [Trichonephila clavipes]
MAAVDFLYRENPPTSAGIEPDTMSAEGQRQTNHATQRAICVKYSVFKISKRRAPEGDVLTKERRNVMCIATKRRWGKPGYSGGSNSPPEALELRNGPPR